MNFSIVISGGTVIDGTGNKAVAADVGIVGDQIAAIGDLSTSTREITIDADGLVVCPGFIDIHTHSELAAIADLLADSKIRQGVTTEIVGNCGSSAVPLIGAGREQARTEFERWGLDMSWQTTADYLNIIHSRRPAVNIGILAGHGNLRTTVIGPGEQVAADDDIAAMAELLRTEMEQGALGLSTGLYYAPGCYAGPGEVLALLRIVAEHRGMYATHLRGETTTLRAAITEAITDAAGAGSCLHIAHLKAAGRNNRGQMGSIIAMLEEARAGGLTVTCDVYPYLAGSTSLSSLLPPWVQSGGTRKMVSRLQDPDVTKRIISELRSPEAAWDNMGYEVGLDNVLICRVIDSSNQGWEGMSVAAIAGEMNVSPEQALCDLVASGEAGAGIITFHSREEDMREALQWRYSAIGSDATAITPGGPAARGLPHPRGYGTFTRVLGVYGRDLGCLAVEEAVRKMTGLPAGIIGLGDRGVIAEGKAADVTVFDPAIVTDRATFEQPLLAPAGVVSVVVNGVIALERGEPTGNRGGRALRNR